MFHLLRLCAFLQKCNIPKNDLTRTCKPENRPKTPSRPHSTKTPSVSLSWAQQTALEVALARFCFTFCRAFVEIDEKRRSKYHSDAPPYYLFERVRSTTKIAILINFKILAHKILSIGVFELLDRHSVVELDLLLLWHEGLYTLRMVGVEHIHHGKQCVTVEEWLVAHLRTQPLDSRAQRG